MIIINNVYNFLFYCVCVWGGYYFSELVFIYPSFFFFWATMDDPFNVMKTSKTLFHYLFQAFVENGRLECGQFLFLDMSLMIKHVGTVVASRNVE